MYSEMLLMVVFIYSCSASITVYRGGNIPINITNQIRRTYNGLPDMVYNRGLENAAGACAMKIMKNNLWDTAGSHPCNPGKDGQSENLYLQTFATGKDQGLVYKQAIDSWNHEKTLVQGYLSRSSDELDYFRSFVATEVGHYTQLVWKSTNQVGCAAGAHWIAEKQLRVIIVCRYTPPGNYYSPTVLRANIPGPSDICKDERTPDYCNKYKHMCNTVLYITRQCFRTCGKCEKWGSLSKPSCTGVDTRSDCANAVKYCKMDIIRNDCQKTCKVQC